MFIRGDRIDAVSPGSTLGFLGISDTCIDPVEISFRFLSRLSVFRKPILCKSLSWVNVIVLGREVLTVSAGVLCGELDDRRFSDACGGGSWNCMFKKGWTFSETISSSLATFITS